ncbi:Dedicator of cytokinesis protein 10 [Cichlidogyrus casuarinus]|uniref:Dedicator of cytokinesis protein 10 n=1 Tax=Cichlidogyrus casuarinus TaxID=1844966 RepID=A0ABD2QGY1_9PLAT
MNKDGKVDRQVLDQIAGLNKAGSLNQLQGKKNVANLRPSSGQRFLKQSATEALADSSDDSASIATTDSASLPDQAEDDEFYDPEEEGIATPENETPPSFGEYKLNRAGNQLNGNNNRKVSTGSRNSLTKFEPPEISKPSVANLRKNSPLQEQSTEIRTHVHKAHSSDGMTSRHLGAKSQKEALLCALQILSLLDDNSLGNMIWLMDLTDRLHFLRILIFSVHHLKYTGKSQIDQFSKISGLVTMRGSMKGDQASGPASRQGSLLRYKRGESALGQLAMQYTPAEASSTSSSEDMHAKLSANLSTECGLVVIDILSTFCSVFRKELDGNSASSSLFRGIIEVVCTLLSTDQSETVLKHTFAFCRVFVNRFARILFCESNDTLGLLCEAVLRCANIQTSAQTPESDGQLAGDVVIATNLRLDACGLLYRMWRNSFELFGRLGFCRVHLQTIISISKLVTEIGPQFEASLSVLMGLAKEDVQRSSGQPVVNQSFFGRLMGTTSHCLPSPITNSENGRHFLSQVDDLIKRIQGVLVATEEMRKHKDDHARLVDLHYSLAKSYASNPALRKTWLEELFKLHEIHKCLAEAAMAKLHIAALASEHLKRRGEFPQGHEAFAQVSDNISKEEGHIQADPTLVEMACSHQELLLDIQQAAVAMDKAGMWEAMKPIYDLIIPVYEMRRDWTKLTNIYHHLGSAYEAVLRAESGAQRLFASYYRVSFFGQPFESQAGKTFIYRANPCFKLHDMCQLLLQIYVTKYGQDNIELINDSFIMPSPDEIRESGKGYLLISFVEPCLNPKPASTTNLNESGAPVTAFELNHNVRFFKFETPFTRSKNLSADECLRTPGLVRQTDFLESQWRRRTVLETEATFPHLRTRLEVVRQEEEDLSPIDAAIDSIGQKNRELEVYMTMPESETASVVPLLQRDGSDPASGTVGTSLALPKRVASKKHGVPLLMDMRLQGALLPTVNQGPMAYANAFLSSNARDIFSPHKVDTLKSLFLTFLSNCHILLTRNATLLLRSNAEKFKAMRSSLDKYRVDLSNLLQEEVCVEENTLRYFVKKSCTPT